MRISPARGVRKPMIALNSVDLPEPLTPTRPQMVPGPSSNEASRSAVVPLG